MHSVPPKKRPVPEKSAATFVGSSGKGSGSGSKAGKRRALPPSSPAATLKQTLLFATPAAPTSRFEFLQTDAADLDKKQTDEVARWTAA